MEFKLKVNGLVELQEKLANAPEKLRRYVAIEVKDTALAIESAAKGNIHRNGGNIGNLWNQIIATDVTSDPDCPRWTVASNADYSGYVEFGTLEKVVVPDGLAEFASGFKGEGGYSGPASSITAKQAIYQWCKNKGIDKRLWWPIYVEVMQFGRSPKPFFYPAVKSIAPQFIDKIDGAIKKSFE